MVATDNMEKEFNSLWVEPIKLDSDLLYHLINKEVCDGVIISKFRSNSM